MHFVKPTIIDKGAELSPNRLYRYRLWRRWGDGSCMTFIGLNPSTADETADDQTIRKCIGFAQRNGCEAIEMLNLFAFRATYPVDLKAARDPVGRKNDSVLLKCTAESGIVIACWGIDGTFQHRNTTVRRMLSDVGVTVQCLGFTKAGLPRHPVMCPYAAGIVPFGD